MGPNRGVLLGSTDVEEVRNAELGLRVGSGGSCSYSGESGRFPAEPQRRGEDRGRAHVTAAVRPFRARIFWERMAPGLDPGLSPIAPLGHTGAKVVLRCFPWLEEVVTGAHPASGVGEPCHPQIAQRVPHCQLSWNPISNGQR